MSKISEDLDLGLKRKTTTTTKEKNKINYTNLDLHEELKQERTVTTKLFNEQINVNSLRRSQTTQDLALET